MRGGLTLLLTGLLAAPVTLHAQARPPTSQSVSPEETLWQQIVSLKQGLTAPPADSDGFDARLSERRTLLERARLYLTLYPGGVRRDEAVRLELTMLFEVAVLGGDDLAPLEARVREYLGSPPSDEVLHEAAYWDIICRRQRGVATSQPSSGPVQEPDGALRAAYRAYVERYPTSRYTPRLAAILFAHARRHDDRQGMRGVVRQLSAALPAHAVTAMLAAQLRQADAVGRPFRLTFSTAAGGSVDTREWVGRPVLIVVWAGFDAAARRCVVDVEAFRQEHTELLVVGVNLDASVAELSAARQDLGITWPQFNDGLGWANEFVREWGVRRIPRVFVVDRAGRLVGVGDSGGWRKPAQQALEN